MIISFGAGIVDGTRIRLDGTLSTHILDFEHKVSESIKEQASKH